MKIAINKCYGGFSVTNAVTKLLKEKGVNIPDSSPLFKEDDGCHHLSNEDFGIEDNDYNKWRADKRLIEAIEEVGEEKSSTRLSRIVIIDIPDDVEWEIDDYDGIESIHEVHRSW